MHTNNAQFSLLIASFSLSSTWTPLVTGLLISRVGVIQSAVFATGVICLGQAILYIGHAAESIQVMAIGLLLFGLTISPLSVCQESLIFQLRTSSDENGAEHSDSHRNTNLLLSLALLLGKSASFGAAFTVVPLADAFGEDAPFGLSLLFCCISFGLTASLWLGESWRRRHHLAAGVEEVLEAVDSEPDPSDADQPLTRRLSNSPVSVKMTLEDRVAEKKQIRFGSMVDLGDAFWWYILV